jgi:hypothetical protein
MGNKRPGVCDDAKKEIWFFSPIPPASTQQVLSVPGLESREPSFDNSDTLLNTKKTTAPDQCQEGTGVAWIKEAMLCQILGSQEDPLGPSTL